MMASKTSQRKTSPPPAARMTVTQVRSGIGFDEKQRQALRGLGLRRIRHTVEVEDTPATRGLILKVRHLVTVDGSARLED